MPSHPDKKKSGFTLKGKFGPIKHTLRKKVRHHDNKIEHLIGKKRTKPVRKTTARRGTPDTTLQKNKRPLYKSGQKPIGSRKKNEIGAKPSPPGKTTNRGRKPTSRHKIGPEGGSPIIRREQPRPGPSPIKRRTTPGFTPKPGTTPTRRRGQLTPRRGRA